MKSMNSNSKKRNQQGNGGTGRKVLVAVLMAGLALALAGCGSKKEVQTEQAAINEIGNSLVDEAASEGVDLQAELEQEYNEYLEREQEQQPTDEEQEQEAIKEELKAEMEETYSSFCDVTDPDEIIATAESYNELFDEYSEVLGFDWTLPTRNDIPESLYLAKAMYVKTFMNTEQEDRLLAYDKYGSGFYFYEGEDSETVVVYRPDGSEYRPNVDPLITSKLQDFSVEGITEDTLYISTEENAMFYTNIFPITGSTSDGTQTEAQSRIEGAYQVLDASNLEILNYSIDKLMTDGSVPW